MTSSSSRFRRFTLNLAAFLALASAGWAQQVINATSGKVGVAYSFAVSSSAKGSVVYGAAGLPPGLPRN